MNKTHELKILPEFFDAVLSGDKNFEIRDNTDRDFCAGDIVILREWTPTEGYTGYDITRRTTYVSCYAQRPGFVVFGMRPFTGNDNNKGNGK